MNRKELYMQKLKNPKWQKKRLEVFQRDEFECQLCYSKEKELHCHHLAYTAGNPVDEPIENLLTTCADCHGEMETALKKLRKITDHWQEGEILKAVSSDTWRPIIRKFILSLDQPAFVTHMYSLFDLMEDENNRGLDLGKQLHGRKPPAEEK